MLMPVIIENSGKFLEGLGKTQGCSLCVCVCVLFCSIKDWNLPPDLSLVLSLKEALPQGPQVWLLAVTESGLGLLLS